MKRLLLLPLALFALGCSNTSLKAPQKDPMPAVASVDAEATCSGDKGCTACKNCKYCKHCSKQGGTCGVCR